MADYLTMERDRSVPEADRFADLPHPREMLWYGGDPAAERTLLDAYRSGKLHHAWLLSGSEGVGKATLAYRFARFLLANPDVGSPAVQAAAALTVAEDHPVVGQVARQAHPDLAVIRRGLTKEGKGLRKEISVEDVRDGLSKFRVTSGAGGWRVIIVDAADDLNRAGANALLKMLEEPPRRAVFLLIAHRPGGLMATIRSRCRMLRIPPLSDPAIRSGLVKLADGASEDIDAAVKAAGGSLRDGLAWLDPGQAAIRRDTDTLLADPARQDARRAAALFEKTTGKAGVEAFDIIVGMVEAHLRRKVTSEAGGRATPAALAARAELWEKLRRSARDVETYNLDRRPFLLSVFADLAEIERRFRS